MKKIHDRIATFVKTDYFSKAYPGASFSNGILTHLDAKGHGEAVGFQDNKENYFYTRTLSDPVSTGESITSCGNKIMQSSIRLVAFAWDISPDNLQGFLISRIRSAYKGMKLISISSDYDKIWRDEMPDTEKKRRYNSTVVAIDFDVTFALQDVVSDNPCDWAECEPGGQIPYPTLCQKLEGQTAQAIYDCLSESQVTGLKPLICDEVCPTLCELISENTTAAIRACMSALQVTEMQALICTPCADGTAVLKNTDGNVLSTTPIPSSTSVDITAPDAYVGLFNTLGQELSDHFFKSNSSNQLTAPDAIAIVKDQDGNVLAGPENVASGDTEDIIITLDRSIFNRFVFDADSDDETTVTIDADSAGTFTANALTNVDTVAYEVNAVVATLPFSVVDTDTLRVTIARTAAGQSVVKLTGTYA